MRSWLPVLVAVLLWASAFAASKVAVGSVPHEVAAFLRFGGGAVVLVLVQRFVPAGPDRARVSGPDRLRIGLLGVLGVFGYNTLLFAGLALAPSVDGAVIVPVLSPILTAVTLAVRERRWPSPRQLVGFALAMAGGAVFLAVAASGARSRLLGDLAFLLAAGCWTAYSVRGKAVLGRVSPLRVTTGATVAGALLLLPLAAPALTQVRWAELSTGFWLNQAWLAVLPTALANPLFYYGVRRIGPGRATAFMFLVPGAGLAWSFVLLHESITMAQAVAVLLMLVGAWLAAGPGSERLPSCEPRSRPWQSWVRCFSPLAGRRRPPARPGPAPHPAAPHPPVADREQRAHRSPTSTGSPTS
jgi:drug/metabolite transporter (DMT)-like permease